MMERIVLPFDEIQRVVIRTTALEHEKVLYPIGDSKSETAFIEARDLARIQHGGCNVPKLHRSDTEALLILRHETPFGEQFDRRTPGVLENDRILHARNGFAAAA